MADNAEIRIDGLRELVRDLKAAGDKELDAELKASQLAAAEIVASAARPLVPKVSGALLGTVRAMGSLRSGRVATGRARVPYANPIHWGWWSRGIAPNPFLTDALNLRREPVLDEISAGVERVLEKFESRRAAE